LAVYSDEILNRIKDAVDIVALVSEHVPLKKTGSTYKGLCPFHEEKTPSFNVHPGKGIFHCFGCGRGGDLFKFLMLHQNMPFPEAVRFLAGKAGVSLPEASPPSPADDAEARARKGIREINALAAVFYRDTLASKAGALARKYLEDRGISRESIEAFGLGLAPAGWRNTLEYLGRRGVSPQKAVAAGLAKPRSGREGHYDVFRGRIVFPIRTPDGAVVGFGGRTFEEAEEKQKDETAPKYLNSPDTVVFKKNQILYGFPESREEIRRGRAALLVEGYFDVIALHQHGFKNAVASMGTALTADHVKLLRKEGFCETLILCFDPDAAGEGAARRGGMMLLEQFQQAAIPERWRGGQELTTLLKGSDWNRMTLQALILPPGDDADSFVRTRGAAPFRDLMGKAKNLIDYLLDRLVAASPPDGPIERRLEALQEAGAFLSGQKEAVRREYVRLLSERLRIDEDLAERTLRTEGRRVGQVQATVEVKTRTEKFPPAEKLLAQLLLRHPEIGSRMEIPLELFSDSRLGRIAGAAARQSGSAEGEFIQAVIAAVPDLDVESMVTEFSMEPTEWEDPERAAQDCVTRILEAGLKRRKSQWQSRLDEARCRGDENEIQALLHEGEALRKEKVGLLQKTSRADRLMGASSSG
jgi:DNA primase